MIVSSSCSLMPLGLLEIGKGSIGLSLCTLLVLLLRLLELNDFQIVQLIRSL